MNALIVEGRVEPQDKLALDEATSRECEGILEKHARSFSAAAVFLTREMRRDAAVCYAFCRLVDDAVDEAASHDQAMAQIDVISAMLEGRAEPSPIVRAYVDLARRLEFGLEPARDLLAGARSDLGKVRLETDEQFLSYCYQVAGTVGLMMCGVLGVKDPSARRHAVHLGMAMQMTNICRDVVEDAVRDRVYLPLKRLQKVGVSHDQLLDVAGHGAVPETSRAAVSVVHLEAGVAHVVRGILQWAERFYSSGAEGFRFIPKRPRLAIMVAKVLYREIGQALRSRGYNALLGRVRVTSFRKFTLTVRTVMNWIIGVSNVPQNDLETPARLVSK